MGRSGAGLHWPTSRGGLRGLVSADVMAAKVGWLAASSGGRGARFGVLGPQVRRLKPLVPQPPPPAHLAIRRACGPFRGLVAWLRFGLLSRCHPLRREIRLATPQAHLPSRTTARIAGRFCPVQRQQADCARARTSEPGFLESCHSQRGSLGSDYPPNSGSVPTPGSAEDPTGLELSAPHK